MRLNKKQKELLRTARRLAKKYGRVKISSYSPNGSVVIQRIIKTNGQCLYRWWKALDGAESRGFSFYLLSCFYVDDYYCTDRRSFDRSVKLMFEYDHGNDVTYEIWTDDKWSLKYRYKESKRKYLKAA